MSDLRSRHHDATRRMILDATQQLVVEIHSLTLSMSDVAERAGVSRRTLYRYFATKEELLHAASEHWGAATTGQVVAPIDGLEDLAEYLAGQWRMFAENLAAVLAQHASPSGRDIRERWLPQARRFTDDLVVGALPLSASERDELVDLLVAIMSSSMFLELVERMDHDPERAAHLVAWTVRSILDRAAGDGFVDVPGSATPAARREPPPSPGR